MLASAGGQRPYEEQDKGGFGFSQIRSESSEGRRLRKRTSTQSTVGRPNYFYLHSACSPCSSLPFALYFHQDPMSPAIDPKQAAALHDLPTPEPESPVKRRRPHKFSTLCATVENPGMKDQYGSSAVPIYQSATFKGVNGEFDYSRSGNPTRSHLGE